MILLLAAILALGAGAAWWWVDQPLQLVNRRDAESGTGGAGVDLLIEPGATPHGIAQAVVDAGVEASPQWLYWWFRLSGQSRQIRAGNYELERGITPRTLLRVLVRGEEATRSLLIVEGWNFRQVRAALAKADQLQPTTADESNEDVMSRLGRPGVSPEGRFFPDTYTYSKGSTDLALLQRAMRVMDKKLEAAWNARASDVALKTPDEALILASIIEKETGKAQDRAEISAVFHNRLRARMPLQTDPTVIYGLGEHFDGNLRKKDLQTDTPWNTYTRNGLPPTPIAMPGKAALLAAVQPAPSKALYFVARGDGTSQFSNSLQEHNRAVNRYQRGGAEPAPASPPEPPSASNPSSPADPSNSPNSPNSGSGP
jgi:UPF0755 protein